MQTLGLYDVDLAMGTEGERAKLELIEPGHLAYDKKLGLVEVRDDCVVCSVLATSTDKSQRHSPVRSQEPAATHVWAPKYN